MLLLLLMVQLLSVDHVCKTKSLIHCDMATGKNSSFNSKVQEIRTFLGLEHTVFELFISLNGVSTTIKIVPAIALAV